MLTFKLLVLISDLYWMSKNRQLYLDPLYNATEKKGGPCSNFLVGLALSAEVIFFREYI